MKEKIYKDGIVLTTEINLSLGDRLRVLFGQKLEVTTHTDTENVIGLNQTRSRVHVDRFVKWKSGQGAAEVSLEDKPL